MRALFRRGIKLQTLSAPYKGNGGYDEPQVGTRTVGFRAQGLVLRLDGRDHRCSEHVQEPL